MVAQLRKEGFVIGRYKVRMFMKKLGLTVKNRQRYVVTTNSKYNQPVADNKLNRNFSPQQPDLVWTTDITYIWTAQGWMYLAVVLDLYSRRAVGWHMEHDMTVALVHRHICLLGSFSQLPNYPTTQLPNYPTTQLPNYPTTQLPNYPTTQLPNYPTTQLPNYPTTCCFIVWSGCIVLNNSVL